VPRYKESLKRNVGKVLSGKTALVTGGAHRLGQAIVLALARAGADTVIHYHRSTEAALATADEVLAFGQRASTVKADLGDTWAIQRMFQVVESESGRLDILVNSAAVFESVDFMAMTPEQWDRALDVNLRGPAFCAQAAAHLMLPNGGGHIVNIADVIGLKPWPRFPHHSVAKAGLVMLTQVLAATLAPTIQVNAIAPGPVLKPPGMSEERWQAIGAASLLRRSGQASDVAEAALFLVCSDYITGEVLVVDGGSRFVA
jgi:NAD(P)-dependent dehydrogenase (short-subunit alcohol dehydrogenase family)